MRSRKLLGELLMDAGLLNEAQLEHALIRQHSSGQKLGHILVAAGWLREDQLLEVLSRQLQIAVAPESRLRQVRPPRQALRMVPPEVARRQRILPIFFDERDQSLSLVMADPSDLDALTAIKAQNNLGRLRVLMAGERLLDELIAFHYGPEAVGEGELARGATPRSDPGIPVAARGEARGEAAAPARLETASPDIPRPDAARSEGPRGDARATARASDTSKPPKGSAAKVTPPADKPVESPRRSPTNAPLLLLEPDDQHAQALATWLGLEGHSVLRARDVASLERTAERTPEALIVVRKALVDASIIKALSNFEADRVRYLPAAGDMLEHDSGTGRFVDFYLNTLDFFFSLLEDDKESPSQRHLRQVSRVARMVAQRMGLPPRQVDAIAIGGYLYQFGDFLAKRGVFSQGVASENNYSLTADLWSSFQPPLPIAQVVKALGQELEPGTESALPAAILRTVGTYLEMRDGSRTYARVGHEKALRHLQDNRGSRFEPRVVDALIDSLAKEQLLGQLEVSGAAGHEVLLVDKDRVTQEVLELRFIKEGFRVRTARTGEEALKMIETQRPNLVISEITLPKIDGFELCSRLKSDPETRDLPFFFLSGRTDTFHVTKGLELGADDYLTKPVNLDILISKVKRLERVVQEQRQAAPSGVQGSLSEMGLLDLLQVLQLGMKTARVALNRGQLRCELFLDQGNLVYAALGDRRGQDAFFELCSWDTGTFAVTPGVAAPERNLHESNDFLLMEGMRRADELGAGILQAGKG